MIAFCLKWRISLNLGHSGYCYLQSSGLQSSGRRDHMVAPLPIADHENFKLPARVGR
jgi:hypothetical protein